MSRNPLPIVPISLQYRPAHGAPAGRTVRVLLAEPQPRLQDELAAIDGVRLVGAARSYAQVLYLAGQAQPDAVVLDCFDDPMDVLDTLAALQQLSHSAVLLHGLADRERSRRALAAGASAVLEAGVDGGGVLAAILRVRGSEPPAPAGSVRPPAAAPGAARLTTRERELVRAIVTWPSAKYLVIGSQLGISEHTVHNHLSSIYQKLQLVNRADLLIYAVRHRIAADCGGEPEASPLTPAAAAPVLRRIRTPRSGST